MRFVIVGCLVSCLAVVSEAQPATILADVILEGPPEFIVADRPGFADGPNVVGYMRAHVELGITSEDAGDSLLTIPTLLRYGLTDNVELRVESGLIGFSSGNGDWAPVAAGFKWRMREGDVPIALLASVQPPSGGSRLGTREYEAGFRIVSDVELGGGFSVTPNVGLAFVEGGGADALFAASLERDLGNIIPFVDFEIQTGDETSMIVDGGVAWIVHYEMQLDVSAGVDVAGDAYPEWFIGAGISHRF